MSILVYVTQHQGQAQPIAWEVMGKAREMADKLGVPVVGFIAGHQVGEAAKDAIAYGADLVLVADDPAFAQFRAYAYAEALKAAITAAKPVIILAPAVAGARDAAALAACQLNIGLAADCQGLDLDADGNLLAVRPVFSGNILTTVVFKAKPQMATVRGRSFPLPAKDASRTGEIAPLAVALDELAAQEEVLSFEAAEVGELSVENAGIIVSGGRGVKGPEGFAPIRNLAKEAWREVAAHWEATGAHEAAADPAV